MLVRNCKANTLDACRLRRTLSAVSTFLLTVVFAAIGSSRRTTDPPDNRAARRGLAKFLSVKSVKRTASLLTEPHHPRSRGRPSRWEVDRIQHTQRCLRLVEDVEVQAWNAMINQLLDLMRGKFDSHLKLPVRVISFTEFLDK